MKLKFKADAQDVFIFAIFSLFLLLVVCFAVVNLPYLLVHGKLYSLNPFLAFLPKNIWVTILLFLGLIGIIFFSVSSYFFDMDSGVGFGKQVAKVIVTGHLQMIL